MKRDLPARIRRDAWFVTAWLISRFAIPVALIASLLVLRWLLLALHVQL